MTYIQYPVYWDNGEFIQDKWILGGRGAVHYGWYIESNAQDVVLRSTGSGIYKWKPNVGRDFYAHKWGKSGNGRGTP